MPRSGPEEDALLSRGTSPCSGLQPLERWGDLCRHVWGKGWELGLCWLPKLSWFCIRVLQAPHGASAVPPDILPRPSTDRLCLFQLSALIRLKWKSRSDQTWKHKNKRAGFSRWREQPGKSGERW